MDKKLFECLFHGGHTYDVWKPSKLATDMFVHSCSLCGKTEVIPRKELEKLQEALTYERMTEVIEKFTKGFKK